MILVPVRDEHSLHLVPPSREERDVGEHLLDAELLVVREHEARVEQHVSVLRSHERAVHADLAEAAEGQELYRGVVDEAAGGRIDG